jgi:hypothetical protein
MAQLQATGVTGSLVTTGVVVDTFMLELKLTKMVRLMDILSFGQPQTQQVT